MQIDDIDRGSLEHVQRIANETMTRVILFEAERAGDMATTRALIVEPLSVEVTTNA